MRRSFSRDFGGQGSRPGMSTVSERDTGKGDNTMTMVMNTHAPKRTRRNTMRIMHRQCVPDVPGRDMLTGNNFALVRYSGRNPVRVILAASDLETLAQEAHSVYVRSGESAHLVGLNECPRLPTLLGPSRRSVVSAT